jgi:imidazolonepropionase-like amidohydrolase
MVKRNLFIVVRSGIRPEMLALLLHAECNGANVDQFVRTKAGTVALTHARVIDGTGRAGQDNRTVVVDGGKIRAVGDSTETPLPSAVTVFDLRGSTVIPGRVGMHDHLFYEIQRPSEQPIEVPAQASFAKLYLASGVTTIRTAGAIDFDGDLRIKRLIDDV